MTGASDADAAILVVDAERGVEDQTRRHIYLLGLLSIAHVIVAVNKIDSVAEPERDPRGAARPRAPRSRPSASTVTATVPVSARDGDNVATRSARTPWYDGPALAELLADDRSAARDRGARAAAHLGARRLPPRRRARRRRHRPRGPNRRRRPAAGLAVGEDRARRSAARVAARCAIGRDRAMRWASFSTRRSTSTAATCSRTTTTCR